MKIPTNLAGKFLQAKEVLAPQNKPAESVAKPSQGNFSETFQRLNDSQQKSFAAGDDMVSGGAQNLNQVVSQVEESSLALSLAVSLRNKAIEAYQEIMKIQV